MSQDYQEKAKDLSNMLLKATEYQRLVSAKDAYTKDKEAQDLDQHIADFTNGIQTSIRMGALTTDDYREAVAEVEELENKLKAMPSVKEYLEAETAYNELIASVMGVLDRTIMQLNKGVQGGPRVGSGTNQGASSCATSCGVHGGCNGCGA